MLIYTVGLLGISICPWFLKSFVHESEWTHVIWSQACSSLQWSGWQFGFSFLKALSTMQSLYFWSWAAVNLSFKTKVFLYITECTSFKWVQSSTCCFFKMLFIKGKKVGFKICFLKTWDSLSSDCLGFYILLIWIFLMNLFK